jgi:phosphoribosylaminoimidazolecarboxamide formyltransferase / IMP cyclohydrolase
VDVVPVRRVLVSVSDKTGVVDFCRFLVDSRPDGGGDAVQLLSTGGTAKALREAGLDVTDVSEYTGADECLDGRVKTLHPRIHGGLLAVRGNATHERQMEEQGMVPIDMTILNLYPFERTMQQEGVTYEQCIENIDIGGPSMLRSTAKNHAFTAIVTSPDQYDDVRAEMTANGGTTLALRRRLAAQAFSLSAAYDTAIATWFTGQQQQQQQTQDGRQRLPQKPQPDGAKTDAAVVTREYRPEFPLKYGCNPHQVPSQILSRVGAGLPFDVRNGVPGYINLLDAANAWQLVTELKQATGLAAAASFKHVSPAGAAVAVPLTDAECLAYEVTPDMLHGLTPVALAYLRARNADPLCSFGDFSAVSDPVDGATARYLKREVSDGIVAPSYTPEALEILRQKKGGKFIILEARAGYHPGEVEYREVYGMTFAQRRNDVVIGRDQVSSANVVTSVNGTIDEDAVRDLIVASICIKYTQSNSVGFAKDGMMVGVGAGQQSRVDCVKLAGRKVQTWHLRQHPKVLALPFRGGVKRQERVNARVRYIEGDLTDEERVRWEAQFETVPSPLTEEEKSAFLKESLAGVSLSSDAFFPFRDSIDHASKLGVSYVAQPGGSVQDDQVKEACDEYGMAMCLTGVRLFHH